MKVPMRISSQGKMMARKKGFACLTLHLFGYCVHFFPCGNEDFYFWNVTCTNIVVQASEE